MVNISQELLLHFLKSIYVFLFEVTSMFFHKMSTEKVIFHASLMTSFQLRKKAKLIMLILMCVYICSRLLCIQGNKSFKIYFLIFARN